MRPGDCTSTGVRVRTVIPLVRQLLGSCTARALGALLPALIGKLCSAGPSAAAGAAAGASG